MLPYLSRKRNSFSEAFRAYAESGLPNDKEAITKIQFAKFDSVGKSYHIYQAIRGRELGNAFIAIFDIDQERFEFIAFPNEDLKVFISGMIANGDPDLFSTSRRYNFAVIERLVDLFKQSNHATYSWCDNPSGWPLVRSIMMKHLFDDPSEST